ncbi:MAG TPA: O-antigen ligase family protein [Longimicrobium sp.]|jgi:hypothetical protein
MDVVMNGVDPQQAAPARPRPAAAPRRPRHWRTEHILAKYAIVLLLPFVGTLLSRQAGAAAHMGVYLFLSLWALAGPRRCIEALTLSWLATFLNPGLFASSGLGEVLRWLILAAGAANVLTHVVLRESSLPRAWLWVTGFVLATAGLAVYTSYALDVSLFKLASFSMGSTAVLFAFHLTRHEAGYWRLWFFALFAVVVTAGFPLIVHPLGYFRNGRSFQGITGQPQTYSLFIGPLLAWCIARLITRQDRGLAKWALAGMAALSLVATQGRTGLVAGVAGLLLAGLWWMVSGRMRVAIPRAWIVLVLLAVGAGTGWVATHTQTASRAVLNFMMKGRADAGLDAAFHASRGFLIEASMENFRQNPLTGIGFGVGSDPSSFLVRRDPLLGLPVGASTEKGFTAVAILEEVGLVGMTLFLLMVGALLRPVFTRRATFPTTVLALSALMVNFGESVFFALGGSGMLVWLLMGAARVMAAHEE